MMIKILTLSIKRACFDRILSGETTHEYRDIRPTNGKRYFRYKLGDKLYVSPDDFPEDTDDESEVDLVPVDYEAIKFLTGGCTGRRPYAIVEVKHADVFIATDENGEEIVYEDGANEYLAAYMDYELGRVLEVNLNPQ